MPLPDNYNEAAFQRMWGDAPEWEGVLEANADAFYAAIKRAFSEYPVNEKLRVIAVQKAYGIFSTSLNRYFPLIGKKRQDDLNTEIAILGEAVNDDELPAALQQAEEIVFMCKTIMRLHAQDSNVMEGL